MADQNSSNNKRQPNTLAELGSSKMPASIGRTLDNASPSETQRYQWLSQQQAQIEQDPMYDLGSRNPMLLTNPNAAKQFGSLQNRRASYIRQQEIMEEAAAARANRMVSTTVNQSFSTSTINGQISQRLESTEAQQNSLRIAGSVSPESLQKRISMSEGRMARYGEEASKIKTVNRFGEPDAEAQERLQQLYGLREVEMNRRTGMVGAARIHRQQGLDPESRMDSLVRSAGQANDIMGRQSPEITKLMGMSGSDFRKHESQAADRLATAFEKLSQVADTTSEEFKNLKKEAEEAEKGFKDVQKAKGEGGGGGNGITQWQMAGAGFQAAAAATQAIGVNQRLGMEQNQTGYANWENQRYATYKGAMSGDVASAMMLGQFDPAMDFGKELGVNAQSAALLQMGGGAMQVAAGGTEVGSAANPISDILATSTAANVVKQGAMDVMAGGAVTATAGMDAFRGVSEHQATLAGASARLEKMRAVQAIGAEQMQGFRDFGVGLSGAAMGMGSSGNAFLESTATAAQLSKLSSARISPAQFAEMAQQGVNSMGSGFNSEQIMGARSLERRGLGSMSENMQRMSTLYSAGANNPQEGLGKILAEAIPRGFDNSKLVGQLVQSSAAMAMAAGGAATGLNMTGAAASLLTSGIGPGTQNKEAMLQHAADVAGGFSNAETNTSTSYRGMLNVARMQQATGKGGVDAVIAAGTNIEQLMSIRDMGGDVNDKARRQALITAGFDPNTSGAGLNKVIRAKQMADLDFGGTTGVTKNNAALLERMEKAGSYNSMGEDDQRALSKAARLGAIGGQFSAGTTGEDIFKRTMGMNSKVPGGDGKSVFSDKDVGKMQKDMDNLRTQGFVQLAKSAGAAATALDGIAGAGKGFTKIVEMFDKIEKQSSGIEKGASGKAGAAAKRGETSTDVKVAVEALGAAGVKLSAILDGIARKYNISLPNTKSGIHQ